ncbi:hypothetical protein BDZ89DRAFT_1255163, partial [Hymenopellis radicata]
QSPGAAASDIFSRRLNIPTFGFSSLSFVACWLASTRTVPPVSNTMKLLRVNSSLLVGTSLWLSLFATVSCARPSLSDRRLCVCACSCDATSACPSFILLAISC